MGLLQGEGMASRFFHRMGASQLARTICSEAGLEGYLYTMGAAEGTATEAFAHTAADLDLGQQYPHQQPAPVGLSSSGPAGAGARVIVIDPAQTRTAQAADEWIPIRPGTDGALALAMMHAIIGERLHDADYVAQHTIGFEQLAVRVREWSPERAATLTGVPAARIRQLAQEYATVRPAAIRINYGLQRHYGGGMAVRTIACLPALVGAWHDLGGGIQLSTSGHFRHLDRAGLYQADLLAGQDAAHAQHEPAGRCADTDPASLARASSILAPWGTGCPRRNRQARPCRRGQPVPPPGRGW